MNFHEVLCFDDVLLVPKFSSIKSRSEVNLSLQLNDKIKLNNPIIPANMKSICEFDMAKFIFDSGGLALLHRFSSIEEQVLIFKNLVNYDSKTINHVGCSVGVKNEDRLNLQQFYYLGCRIVCLDIAHGDCESAVEMIKFIKTTFSDMFIIAGNVATSSGAERLWNAGADCVKCGIGGSGICTTRLETGNGVPTFQTIMDVAENKNYMQKTLNRKLFIIADGGMKNAGDISKSLCFADLVMVGNIFAGTDKTPGEIIEKNGSQYKAYEGSSTHKKDRVEGVKALVPFKGSSENMLKRILEGIQSCCSYQNARNLQELKLNASFVKISQAGVKESGVHDVAFLK